jgi:dihydroflavonol-4-reductase
MRTVLVTGATGFVGTHLVSQLLPEAQGEHIQLRLLCRKNPVWAGTPGVDVRLGDIRDARAVDRAVAGADEIYHLAGVVDHHPEAAGEAFDVHVGGLRHVCDSALVHGKPRILLVSSSGTVAVSAEPRLHLDDDPYPLEILKQWPYYLSKVYAEKLAYRYVEDHHLPLLMVNPSLLLGPGDLRLSSSRVVRWFLDGQIKTLSAGGLNFVDARDTAALLVKAMRQGEVGRRYLLGGYNMTFGQFFSLLGRVARRSPPRLRVSESLAHGFAAVGRLAYPLVGRSFDVDATSIAMSYKYWLIDLDRVHANTELGFTPRAAEETVGDTVEFLRTNRASGDRR